MLVKASGAQLDELRLVDASILVSVKRLEELVGADGFRMVALHDGVFLVDVAQAGFRLAHHGDVGARRDVGRTLHAGPERRGPDAPRDTIPPRSAQIPTIYFCIFHLRIDAALCSALAQIPREFIQSLLTVV